LPSLLPTHYEVFSLFFEDAISFNIPVENHFFVISAAKTEASSKKKTTFSAHNPVSKDVVLQMTHTILHQHPFRLKSFAIPQP
jgi:hypothetical protein